jgi:predicted transcriptional regulator
MIAVTLRTHLHTTSTLQNKAQIFSPPYGTIWSVARTQTLVQLDDQLLANLDQRAAERGVSRSKLIRDAIESYLAADIDAAIDAAIEAGYHRRPPDEPGTLLHQIAVASIEAEPW